MHSGQRSLAVDWLGYTLHLAAAVGYGNCLTGVVLPMYVHVVPRPRLGTKLFGRESDVAVFYKNRDMQISNSVVCERRLICSSVNHPWWVRMPFHQRGLGVARLMDMMVLDFSKAFDSVPHGRLLRKLQHDGN